MNLTQFAGVSRNEMPCHQFYRTIVNKLGLAAVMSYVPFDMDTLQKAYAEDHNFNTPLTPLSKWDKTTGIGLVSKTGMLRSVPEADGGGLFAYMASKGITSASVAECVCILKQAAEMAVLKTQAGIPVSETTLEELLDRAEKDRFALIIDMNDIPFAERHLREIYEAYPCTGVLYRRNTKGTVYHLTRIENADSIKQTGLCPSMDNEATYGGGVIYAFPELSCYQKIEPEQWALFRLEYGPGCLQALATFDRPDNEQHEVLIFPNRLLSCEQIPIPLELQKGAENT